MVKNMKKLTLLLCFAIQVAACASDISPHSSIAVGSIVAMHEITINKNANSSLNQKTHVVSSGNEDSWGALNIGISQKLDQMIGSLASNKALEYTVRLDNGREVTIIEDKDKILKIGQRVVVEINPDHESKIAAY